MKRFAWTIAALVIFVGLLVWTLTKERGRVPEKEEVFRGEIASADDLTGIEVVKFETQPVDEEPSEEDEDEDEGEAEDEAEAKDEDKAKDKHKDKDPNKRVETKRIAMQKRGDEWYLTKPFEGLIDPDTAKSMVKAIVELKPSVNKDVNPSGKEFELDNPTLEVTASLQSGKQIKITVGVDTPVGAKLFAKISDREGLFLLPSMFKTDLDKEPDKLRDKKLARFEKDDVTRVTFVNQNGTVTAEREKKDKDKDNWNITRPARYKGDEWSITSAFGKAGEVEAKEFADKPKDLKKFGLDKPRAQCKIELKDGKVIEVAIGKQIKKKVKASEYSDTEEEKELVWAMRKGRPEVLLVETTLFDDLNKNLMALRDKHILDIERDQVMAVKVARRKGLTFAVTRAGDDWMIQTPQTGKANKTKVDDILWDLTDLEAKEYLAKAPDMKAIGLAVPSTVITLKLSGDKSIKIKFGDEVKEGAETSYYCQTSESKQVYKVGDLALKDLPEDIEALKEGAPDSFSDTDDLTFGSDFGEEPEGF